MRVLITAAYRRRQQEPLGLQDLVRAAQLPRQVAPVPGDQDLGARVWTRPGVSFRLYTFNTQDDLFQIHYKIHIFEVFQD